MFLAVSLSVFLALGLGSAAQALSCAPYQPVDAYRDAEASEHRFVVVYGRLRFDDRKLPVADWDRQQDVPPVTKIPATISGHALTGSGFDSPFSADVTLEVLCYGPWCSSALDGRDYLAFLERRGRGYVLSVNPCGGFGFAEPRPEALKQIGECFNGRRCEASDF